jgi:hypothetical protein
MTIRGYARDVHQEQLLLDAGAEVLHREKYPSSKNALARVLLSIRCGDVVLLPRGVDLLEDIEPTGATLRIVG